MIKVWALLLILFPALAHAATTFSVGSLQFIETNPYLAVFGLGLIILEFMLPTKGLLGLLGIVFFALGTASLATNPNEMLHLTWTQIIVLNVLVIGVALFVAYKTFRDYNIENSGVTESLLSQPGTVIDWTENLQRVEVGGVVWLARAQTAHTLQKGDKIVVTAQDNLTLIVTPTGE